MRLQRDFLKVREGEVSGRPKVWAGAEGKLELLSSGIGRLERKLSGEPGGPQWWQQPQLGGGLRQMAVLGTQAQHRRRTCLVLAEMTRRLLYLTCHRHTYLPNKELEQRPE